MALEVDEMRCLRPDDTHEFVVARETGRDRRAARRSLYAGNCISFQVVEGGGASDDAPARREPWSRAWIASTTDDEHLAERPAR
jgi:hypothetical protein